MANRHIPPVNPPRKSDFKEVGLYGLLGYTLLGGLGRAIEEEDGTHT